MQQQWRLLNLQKCVYEYINMVDAQAFGLCFNSDGQWGVNGKRTLRLTHTHIVLWQRPSDRGAVATPSMRDESHDSAKKLLLG